MAFAVDMLIGALCSLKAVVKKHPNVSAAITLNVKANIVLALDKNVFILPVNFSDTTAKLSVEFAPLKILVHLYPYSHGYQKVQFQSI